MIGIICWIWKVRLQAKLTFENCEKTPHISGGPNLVKNFVDATLIVNATAQEYYKQPIWHVMAQFSKFIKPGSTRIGTTIIEKSVDVEGLSFLNADGTKTVVLLNKNEVTD